MANSDQVTADLQRQRDAADLAARYPSSGRPGSELLRPSADPPTTTTTDLTVGPTVYGSGGGDSPPTDPAQFQQYLNDHGANPPLQVDGIIGPLTLQAAQQLGVTVPPSLAAQPTTTELTVGPDVIGPGGGGTSGGGSAAAPAGSSLTGPGGPIPGSDDDVRAKYGAYAWALDIPQVGDALRKAAAEGWTPTQLQAAIQQTDWWKTTSASIRSWTELTQDDRASAEAQIGQRQADIGVSAAKSGINISADRQRQIATDSLRLGWDSTQLQQAIAAEFHYQPGAQEGTIATAEATAKAMADDYDVRLDDATLANYDQQIAQGTTTAADFKQKLVDLAKSKFPGLANQITLQNATSNVVSPWRTLIAQELGQSPGMIDFTQPKFNRFLNQIDPKTGVATPMSLYDTQRTIRGDDTYGWQYTKNGQDAGYQFAHNFLQAVGKAPA